MPAVIGIDFGTESARAIVVDVRDGRVLGSGASAYAHGVIRRAPAVDRRRPRRRSGRCSIPATGSSRSESACARLLAAAAVTGADVIGLGIDFTACTALPVRADGSPLMLDSAFAGAPHAWPKLWKHHASQPARPRA